MIGASCDVPHSTDDARRLGSHCVDHAALTRTPAAGVGTTLEVGAWLRGADGVQRHFRLGLCSHDAVPCAKCSRSTRSGFAPLASDMERVETELAASVRSEDPFLGEVAGHLIKAGGKRLRPALTLCAGVRRQGLGPADRRRDHRRRRGRARAPRVAVPRRRDRRGRDAPRRPERERPLEQHRRDPRRRLPARPRVRARGVARRRRRRAARRDDRRAVPRSGARAAAPLRRRPLARRSTSPRSAARPPRCSRTACRIGGMVSGVDEPTLDALTDFGHHLGVCFQIVDDVPRRHRDRRLARQARGQRPARGRLHAARHPRARAHAGAARPARSQARRRRRSRKRASSRRPTVRSTPRSMPPATRPATPTRCSARPPGSTPRSPPACAASSTTSSPATPSSGSSSGLPSRREVQRPDF